LRRQHAQRGGGRGGYLRIVGLMHTPNGLMFVMGFESVIVAAGCDDAITLATGNTVSEDGAAPKVHWNIAPFTTT
jgi:hypothetical protein